MKLVLALLIFFSGTVLSKYYEKRRFDRSINEYLKVPQINAETKKEWIFTDDKTNFVAYRDREENNCYIGKLDNYVVKEEVSKKEIQQKKTRKSFYGPNEPLTKIEAWKIAGGRVVNFCTGRTIFLLQYNIPIPKEAVDPFFNILPYDENDIVTRRVADVILTPLISRAKRQAALLERLKLNENLKQNRNRRQIQQSAGKFRGQTQSQYLSMGSNDKKEGRAEAEATRESSRAVVSGTYGMGQAQSMSLGSAGCEDCSKYTTENALDRYIQRSHNKNAGTDYGSISAPSFKQSGDSILPPNTVTSGTATVYPNNIAPGTTRIIGTEVNYPRNIPGSRATYPGTIQGVTTGTGVTYHKNIDGPTTGANAPYPGETLRPTTGGHVAYPEGALGPSAEVNVPYPGGTMGSTAGGNGQYPARIFGPATVENIPYSRGVLSPSAEVNIPYSGGVLGPITGAHIPYPRGVEGSTTGDNIQYPGGILGPTTVQSMPYPVGVPSTVSEGNVPYPGGSPQRATGGSALYPESIPGTVTGRKIPYSSQVPESETRGGIPYSSDLSRPVTEGYAPYSKTTSGAKAESSATATEHLHSLPDGSVVYHAGVPDSRTGSESIHHGRIPGAIDGSGTIYPRYVPTSYYSRPESGTIAGRNVPYPGILSGRTTSDIPVYPSGVSTIAKDEGLVQPGRIQDPLAIEKVATYPNNIRTHTKDNSQGQIVTESKAIADTEMYPNGQVPRNHHISEGYYPTNGETSMRGNGYQNAGSLGIQQGGTSRDITATDTRGTYPGSISPPGSQLPDTIHYPERVPSNIAINRDTILGIPGSTLISDQTNYPASTFPGNIKTSANSHTIDRGTTFNPDTTYPESTRAPLKSDNIQTQKFNSDQSGISYPHDHINYLPGSMPQGHKVGTVHPGYSLEQEQYHNTARWHDRGILNPALIREPPRAAKKPDNGQYPGYQQPDSFQPAHDDTSNSQASSSVKQTDSGTQASASAQGKYSQGTAQSQVTGTYSGSGSFSAQAGSTDDHKSVQTEINGGKEGAASNAQGVGGYGKSQAQVQLNSDSGATVTGAQSSGWNHGTNSQVQASSKGGMADAQANGEGSTSSQAQIGFQPYFKTDEKIEKHVRPFHGGGSASAQSGAHTGQSQSQLEGSFQYGITYTGAAQAGSGSGAATSRKPFNFSLTDTELFKPFKPSYRPDNAHKIGSKVRNTSSDSDYENNPEKLNQGLQTSSTSIRKTFNKPTALDTQNVATTLNQSFDRSQVEDTVYDYEEDYDGEDYDTSPIQSSSNAKNSKIYISEQNNSHHQAQAIYAKTGNQYVKQDTNTEQVDSMLQPGDSLSGYTVPTGFRGRIASRAGDETIAQGDGKSQSQTLALIPKESNMAIENRSPISEVRSLKTNHERLIENAPLKVKQRKHLLKTQNQQISTEYSRPISSTSIKPSYYTITNSVAGKMDDRNSARKYEHRYYTKSSTCGYFTFSCNVVYGSNGRKKICKPKMPTYPDGTPIKC